MPIRRQSSRCCRFNPDCRQVTIQEYLTRVPIKDVVRSSVKVSEFDKHLKKAGGHIVQNIVEITKMKTIVKKTLNNKKALPERFHQTLQYDPHRYKWTTELHCL